jgi:UDP-N-acetylglucosamine 2-epimerase (non-hydrolysing)
LRDATFSAIVARKSPTIVNPSPLRVLVVLGTRPEAVKLFPVIACLRQQADVRVRVLATGQHRKMLDDVLGPFGVQPDLDLDIMRPRQSLNELVARIVPGFDQVLDDERPDVVVVQGDTTTAFCAALVGFHRRIKVAHVEAGLRSGDRFHPYPEEVNRRMIASCADVHLAPTAAAAQHLLTEGVPDNAIFVTGNTGIDALLLALAKLPARALDEPGRRDVLITLHRREAWNEPTGAGKTALDDILSGIADVASAHSKITFTYPVHLNPAVREPVSRVLAGKPNVRLVEPMPYLDFVGAMRRSEVIVTDSGGIQEEAPSLGVPVLVIRKTTERAEALGEGRAKLVGITRAAVREAVESALSHPGQRPPSLPCPNPFGDGRASERILQALLFATGRSAERPEPFVAATPSQGRT